jgi:hypothetical protein
VLERHNGAFVPATTQGRGALDFSNGFEDEDNPLSIADEEGAPDLAPDR